MYSNRTPPAALAGALIFVLTCSGTTLAQDADNRGADRFARLDANGDAVVSLEEFLAAPTVANLDSNGDGAVSLEELMANRQSGRPNRARPGAAEPDANRSANRDERRAQMGDRMRQRLEARLAEMDADEDGIVSVTEVLTANFHNLDRDGDGLLQSGELTGRRGGGGFGAGRRGIESEN